jgi:hypothetical protein
MTIKYYEATYCVRCRVLVRVTTDRPEHTEYVEIGGVPVRRAFVMAGPWLDKVYEAAQAILDGLDAQTITDHGLGSLDDITRITEEAEQEAADDAEVLTIDLPDPCPDLPEPTMPEPGPGLSDAAKEKLAQVLRRADDR